MTQGAEGDVDEPAVEPDRRVPRQRKRKGRKYGGQPDELYWGGEEPAPRCLREPDMPPEEYERKASESLARLEADVDTPEKARPFQRNTKGQHDNPNCGLGRRWRLGSSEFGEIVNRQPHTSVACFVRRFVYDKGNVDKRNRLDGDVNIMYGRDNEETAVQKYVEITGADDIEENGTFVVSGIAYVCATPDRLRKLAGGNILLEIKNKPGIGKRKFWDCATAKGKAKPPKFPLEVRDGKLQLSRKHGFYYQVQGQLELANREYCDFIVQSDEDFHVERIERDRECWDVAWDVAGIDDCLSTEPQKLSCTNFSDYQRFH